MRKLREEARSRTTSVWEIQIHLPPGSSLATLLDPAEHSVPEHNSKLQRKQREFYVGRIKRMLCSFSIENQRHKPLPEHRYKVNTAAQKKASVFSQTTAPREKKEIKEIYFICYLLEGIYHSHFKSMKEKTKMHRVLSSNNTCSWSGQQMAQLRITKNCSHEHRAPQRQPNQPDVPMDRQNPSVGQPGKASNEAPASQPSGSSLKTQRSLRQLRLEPVKPELAVRWKSKHRSGYHGQSPKGLTSVLAPSLSSVTHACISQGSPGALLTKATRQISGCALLDLDQAEGCLTHCSQSSYQLQLQNSSHQSAAASLLIGGFTVQHAALHSRDR